MGWFGRRVPGGVGRLRIAALAGLSAEERAAVFAGAEGARWIEAAAAHGLVEAQVLWGQGLRDRGEDVVALWWFEAAAAAGYAPGVNMVGRCCELGWGRGVDLVEAARCYRVAAEGGYDWGMFNLAGALLGGLGVERDRVGAYGWYARAAEGGHAKAMNMVARFHEEGWDRPVDLVAAAWWYRGAAEGGDFRGQFNWGTILAGSGRVAEGVAWVERALAGGSADFLAEARGVLARHPVEALRGLVGVGALADPCRRAAGPAGAGAGGGL